MIERPTELTFASVLRRHRLAAGLTQAELAERAGISERAVSDLERSIGRVPRRDTAQLLATALALDGAERATFDLVVKQARSQAIAAEPSLSVEVRISPVPPMLKASPSGHNLPAALSNFIGRDHELGQVRALLASDRLVTLTGPGGCGKTRLALAVAESLFTEYPSGVWLVELAALADPGFVPAAVADVLQVTEGPGRPVLQTLTSYLRDCRLLLVLDNCEHLLDACVAMVSTLTKGCPFLQILATSREGLHVAGERRYQVPPLSVPDPQHLPTPDLVGAYEAVRLFVRRAQEHREDFALTQANAGVIAEVCARLDGMPLAIELAAARVESMNVEAIAARLHDRFRLLSTGSRDLPSRQRTLRAVLDWSWELLSADEKTLLSRLSVFVDGCILEAAEAVCLGNGLEAYLVLDGLSSLVNKSLVQFDAREDGAPRYRLLETVHQYAAERLTERDERVSIRDRHLVYFLTLAEEAVSALNGTLQRAWMTRLDREHDNMRGALTWARESGAADLALQLAGALGKFWLRRSHFVEGQAWLEATLAENQGLPVYRARALVAAGTLAHSLGDYARATALHTEALILHRSLGDRSGVADSLIHLGSIAENQGDFARATTLLEESLVLYRDEGDSWSISRALNAFGWLMVCLGDNERAVVLLKEALEIKRSLGDRAGISFSLNQLALAVGQQGEYQFAMELQEESLTLQRELGDKYGIADVLINMGRVAYWQGDYIQATTRLAEGLRLSNEIGARITMMISLEWLGRSAAAVGEYRRAAQLHGVSHALRVLIGARIPPSEIGNHDLTLDAIRKALGDQAFDASWDEGLALPLEQAVALALSTLGAGQE